MWYYFRGKKKPKQNARSEMDQSDINYFSAVDSSADFPKQELRYPPCQNKAFKLQKSARVNHSFHQLWESH